MRVYRRPIRALSRCRVQGACPATTLSDRRDRAFGATCAFRAGERLHDPVHENDKPERYLFRNSIDELGAPLRNRTVDLLLTIPKASRPERTSCTERTPERSESTESTGCSSQPVHDSF